MTHARLSVLRRLGRRRPPAERSTDRPRAAAVPSDLGRARDAAEARRRDPSIAELKALADHAAQRLALYRRRMYLGRGEAHRLAELERVAAGAIERLRRARARGTGA